MELFVEAIDREIDELDRNGIRLRFIGELVAAARRRCASACARPSRAPRANTRMTLLRRDRLRRALGHRAGGARAGAARRARANCDPRAIDEAVLRGASSRCAGAPDPDLFIRTGGEQRISNFLLWNLAYTELYFCDTLWPDFDDAELELALQHYARRQRRFGLAPAQVRAVASSLCSAIVTALLLAGARHLRAAVAAAATPRWSLIALAVLLGAWEWAGFAGCDSRAGAARVCARDRRGARRR